MHFVAVFQLVGVLFFAIIYFFNYYYFAIIMRFQQSEEIHLFGFLLYEKKQNN